MAVSAYEVISTQTLASAAASVTFSSIPQTYTDLVLVINGVNSADRNVVARFNGDTSTIYSSTRLYGTGSSAATDLYTTMSYATLSAGNTTLDYNIIARLDNYSNATTYKTIFTRSNITGDIVGSTVSTWRGLTAISTLLLMLNGAGNFNTGSTFTLYGIKAA